MEILSVNNDLIKNTVKLQEKKYRDESGKFIIEGFKALGEALNYGIEIEKIFLLKGTFHKYDENKVILVSEPVLKKISTTSSAPEVVAVGFKKTYDITLLKNAKKVALFENINDLGNLGTILRTATATGIDAIILFSDTVDIYNPKCIRASVGNLWKTPVFNIKDFNLLQGYFSDFERIATLPKSTESTYLKDFTTSDKMLIMFGSEGSVLSEKLIEFSTKKLTLEMKNDVESLNLSISAGIILYKLFLL